MDFLFGHAATGIGRDGLRCAFRDVQAQQPVGVLVRAALPRTLWIAEVDGQIMVDAQFGMTGHLRPLVPGQ